MDNTYKNNRRAFLKSVGAFAGTFGVVATQASSIKTAANVSQNEFERTAVAEIKNRSMQRFADYSAHDNGVTGHLTLTNDRNVNVLNISGTLKPELLAGKGRGLKDIAKAYEKDGVIPALNQLVDMEHGGLNNITNYGLAADDNSYAVSMRHQFATTHFTILENGDKKAVVNTSLSAQEGVQAVNDFWETKTLPDASAVFFAEGVHNGFTLYSPDHTRKVLCNVNEQGVYTIYLSAPGEELHLVEALDNASLVEFCLGYRDHGLNYEMTKRFLDEHDHDISYIHYQNTVDAKHSFSLDTENGQHILKLAQDNLVVVEARGVGIHNALTAIRNWKNGVRPHAGDELYHEATLINKYSDDKARKIILRHPHNDSSDVILFSLDKNSKKYEPFCRLVGHDVAYGDCETLADEFLSTGKEPGLDHPVFTKDLGYIHFLTPDRTKDILVETLENGRIHVELVENGNTRENAIGPYDRETWMRSVEAFYKGEALIRLPQSSAPANTLDNH